MHTFFALFGLTLLLISKRVFWIGFFLGVLWFWWIGLSFRYYHLPYLIPFIILFIGVVYGALFAIASALLQKIGNWIIRLTGWKFYFIPFRNALLLFLFFYLHPFGFHWFIPNLPFTDTIFGLDKFAFFLILLSLTPFVILKGKRRFLSLFLLPFALHFYKPLPLAPLNIDLVTTHIPQDKKWDKRFESQIIQKNFFYIDQAIKKRADVVLLPESAFPLFLNEREDLLKKLLALSQKIAIVTGALHYKNGKIFNSTYVFENMRYLILNKVVLVPFGEEIPLPNPFKRWINNLFFDGASDYTRAKEPQIYRIKGVDFTNAICYEATHPLLYQTKTSYMIALSNNAWFLPSYEPILQNIIIKYYAKIYKKVVYHATNIAKTEVIR